LGACIATFALAGLVIRRLPLLRKIL